MIKSQSINDPGLYIGTCSWKYPSWKGLIYSEGVGSDYLREYAKYYNTVEIDQWFWSLHDKKSVSLPKGYTYAVEIRNPNYLNDRYFQFLKEHGLYHVFIQGYYMPSIFTLYKKFGQYITNLTIIRLLGPDRYGIEARCGGKWDQIVDAKEDEIEAVIQMIEDLLSKEIHVYLNVNNHYEGSAPLTINKIKQRLTPSA